LGAWTGVVAVTGYLAALLLAVGGAGLDQWRAAVAVVIATGAAAFATARRASLRLGALGPPVLAVLGPRVAALRLRPGHARPVAVRGRGAAGRSRGRRRAHRGADRAGRGPGRRRGIRRADAVRRWARRALAQPGAAAVAGLGRPRPRPGPRPGARRRGP